MRLILPMRWMFDLEADEVVQIDSYVADIIDGLQ